MCRNHFLSRNFLHINLIYHAGIYNEITFVELLISIPLNIARAPIQTNQSPKSLIKHKYYFRIQQANN